MLFAIVASLRLPFAVCSLVARCLALRPICLFAATCVSPAFVAGHMEKRGGQGSFGYHIQHPPRDKFDPNWKPRRGGKTVRKQKELFERR